MNIICNNNVTKLYGISFSGPHNSARNSGENDKERSLEVFDCIRNGFSRSKVAPSIHSASNQIVVIVGIERANMILSRTALRESTDTANCVEFFVDHPDDYYFGCS